MPGLFGIDTAHITEQECSARGGRACVYALSWGAEAGLLEEAERAPEHEPEPERVDEAGPELERAEEAGPEPERAEAAGREPAEEFVDDHGVAAAAEEVVAGHTHRLEVEAEAAGAESEDIGSGDMPLRIVPESGDTGHTGGQTRETDVAAEPAGAATHAESRDDASTGGEAPAADPGPAAVPPDSPSLGERTIAGSTPSSNR